MLHTFAHLTQTLPTQLFQLDKKLNSGTESSSHYPDMIFTTQHATWKFVGQIFFEIM